MAKKRRIDIYVEVDGGVLQAVYASKEDLGNDIAINVYKMDYDDLSALEGDRENGDDAEQEYMDARAEFDVYEEQIEDETLISIW